jgi:hypothetical protein
MKTKLFLILSLLCMCSWVVADSIPVGNYSFELPATGKIKTGFDSTPDIPSWSSLVCTDSGIEGQNAYAPTDGTWQAYFMSSDGSCWNTLTHVIASGESFQLLIDAHISWSPRAAEAFKMNFYYDNAGTRVLGATKTVDLTTTSVTYNTLRFSANGIPGSIGKKLGIELDDVAVGANGWMVMDNVRVERYFSAWSSPVDGDQTVLPESTLQWAVYNNWNCDVYFGTDPNVIANPKVVNNTVATSYDPPGNLNNDTIYYWRVDAYEPNAVAPFTPIKRVGLVWSFKTIPPIPVITAQPADTLAPVNGSATYTIGVASSTPVHYTWFKTTDNANNTPGDDVAKGSDASTLTINPVAKTDEGYYFCKVTNSSPTTVYSNVVMLGVSRIMAHWALNALDGSGNYPDSSGETPAHDADPNGTPVFVAGVNNPPTTNNGVTIDLSNGYARAGTWNPSQYTGQITISLWAKSAGVTGIWQGLIGKRTAFSADAAMWQLEVDNTDTVTFKNGNNMGVTTPALPIGEWEHLAVTFDGATATFYRKGVSAATGAFSFTAGTNAGITLGATELTAEGVINGTFNGALDDIQIHNYALSDTQIGDIYYEATGKPVCISEYASEFDFNKDCLVNLTDFAAFAAKWLDCGYYPASDCP